MRWINDFRSLTEQKNRAQRSPAVSNQTTAVKHSSQWGVGIIASIRGWTVAPVNRFKCVLNGNNKACWVIDAVSKQWIPMQPWAQQVSISSTLDRQGNVARMWRCVWEKRHTPAVPPQQRYSAYGSSCECGESSAQEDLGNALHLLQGKLRHPRVLIQLLTSFDGSFQAYCSAARNIEWKRIGVNSPVIRAAYV